jgi:hypothetical protein
MKMRLLAALFVITSWVLLAYGAHLIWEPLGALVLGACLWVDAYLGDRLRGRP